VSGAGWAIVLVAFVLSAMAKPLGEGHMAVFGARPDLLAVVVYVAALRLRPRGGVALGFLAGAVSGALAGANMAHWIVSRVLAGFVLGWVGRSRVALSPPVVGAATAAATLGSQLAFMLLAAPPDIGGFLKATIGAAIYNGVLAVVFDMLLGRVSDRKVD
jgi:cell shape-determining protein MreD